MEVCPTEAIDAPVQKVWDLLVEPHQLACWLDAKLDDGPRSILRPGDCFTVRKRGMLIRFQVLDLAPLQYLDFHIQLPFGIVNDERMQFTTLSASACRVTFN
jgi:uncharacterized protein YndB with AHSA1/START domain